MNDSERPFESITPESVWKSINRKEQDSMDITFSPDQLCAMARSRERESIWSRRVLVTLLIGPAAAFAYNVFTVSQLPLRLSQGWMLAWTCLLLWKLRHGSPGMNATENCVSFLRREFEAKRRGLLDMRRYMFFLIPPIAAAWWAGGLAMRMRALGVDRSPGLFEVASGPWPFIIIGLLLLVVWFAFGLAAKKATRELNELSRRGG